MDTLIRLLKSSVGRKYLMALTGLLLVGFVVAHMLGNLQIFMGADTLNGYAAMLKSRPILLWSFRIGLLFAAILHVVTAISLAVENRAARSIPYELKRTTRSTRASLTMLISGLVVLAFIIYHILQFTTLSLHPAYREFFTTLGGAGPLVHDVNRMVLDAFSNRWVSGFYGVSVAFVAMHLSHGVESIFQSLGWRTASSAPLLRGIALTVAWIVFLGMAAVPAAVAFGFVK